MFNVKIAVFKVFLSRAKSICSKEFLNEEINFLINVFVENGYNRKFLKNIVKNHGKQIRKSNINKNTYPYHGYQVLV